MKYIQPMNRHEFAQLLLTLHTGDFIEFGCDPGVCFPDETPSVNDVTAWYFATVISIPQYGSRFILIDYAGGEDAFAIPLNCNRDEPDDDDRSIVPRYVDEFFTRCPDLGNLTDYVFVEMEEKL